MISLIKTETKTHWVDSVWPIFDNFDSNFIHTCRPIYSLILTACIYATHVLNVAQ